MKAKSKTAFRWHPLFIRWCLNIMLTSSKTYDIIRDSGFINLPSKRTLRDYTHWLTSKAGFQDEVDEDLRDEVNIVLGIGACAFPMAGCLADLVMADTS